MTAVLAYVTPAPWAVPRAWAGERCFILCNGESLRTQRL
jgi:hypothetical protein